jgi:hypothetical protein
VQETLHRDGHTDERMFVHESASAAGQDSQIVGDNCLNLIGDRCVRVTIPPPVREISTRQRDAGKDAVRLLLGRVNGYLIRTP